MRGFFVGFVSHIIVLALSASATALPSLGNLSPAVLDAGGVVLEQGWAVDISGDRAIVGAIGYSEAYIFDLSTGQLVHRLSPNDVAANDLFGFSVAIDGNLAVVASGQKNAAYVFDVTTGEQLHKLVSTSNASDFVRSVDIDNGIAVLGTPANTGAALLYDAQSGSLIRRIAGPTSFNKQGFGAVVAIEGNTVAVTSPSYTNRDDVYVLDAQTGNLRWTYGYNTGGGPFYTQDVVIDNDRVVVGGGSFSLFDMPSAYVFDGSSGQLLRQLDIRVNNPGDGYRYQLDVSGDRLVVGAWGTYYPQTGYYTGAVYSFDVNTGSFLETISNPNFMSHDNFGFSVALTNEHLLVGANGVGDNRGVVYSYNLVPEPAMPLSAVMFAALMVGSRGIRGRRTEFLSGWPRMSDDARRVWSLPSP